MEFGRLDLPKTMVDNYLLNGVILRAGGFRNKNNDTLKLGESARRYPARLQNLNGSEIQRGPGVMKIFVAPYP